MAQLALVHYRSCLTYLYGEDLLGCFFADNKLT